MIYETTARDFFYETAESALTYYINCEGVTIYSGAAVKSPNEPNLRINIGRRVSDYLRTSMPDFREFDGVVVPHPEQLRDFSLYDGAGNLLEEYRVLYEFSGVFASPDYAEILNDAISEKADPRQKIFWCNYSSSEGVIIVEKGIINLEIEFSDSFHFGPVGGSKTVCYTANTSVDISTDSDWFTIEHIQGDSGGCIVFNYTTNPDSSSIRDANICFTYTAYTGQKVTCFKATQDEGYYFSVPSNMTEGYIGGYVTIPISTSIPDVSGTTSVSISPSGAASLDRISQTECRIYLSSNSGDTERTITVTFSTLIGDYTTAIIQERIVRYYTLSSLPVQNLTGDTLVSIGVDTNYTSGMLSGLIYSTSDGDAATVTGATDTQISVFINLPPDGECNTVTVYVHSGNTLVDSTEITVCNNYQYPSNETYHLEIKVPWYETGYTITANILTNCLGDVTLSGYTEEYDCELGVNFARITPNSTGSTIFVDESPIIYGGPALTYLVGSDRRAATAETATLITSGSFNEYGDFVMVLTQNTKTTPRAMCVAFSTENNVKYYATVLQFEKPGASGMAFTEDRTSELVESAGVWQRASQRGVYVEGVMSGITSGTSIESAASTNNLVVRKTAYVPVQSKLSTDEDLNSAFASLSYSNGIYTGHFNIKNSGALPKMFFGNIDLVDTGSTVGSGRYPASGGTIAFIQEAPSTPGSGTTFVVRTAAGTKGYRPAGEYGNTYLNANVMYGGTFYDQSLEYSGSTGIVEFGAPEQIYCRNDKFVVSYPVYRIDTQLFAKCLLEYVGIPEGVVEVVNGAFDGSMYLKEVDIPSTVTNISNGLRYCPRLVRVNFNGTVAQWNSVTKNGWNTGSPNAVVYCTNGNA